MIRNRGDEEEQTDKRQVDDHRRLSSRFIDAETERMLLQMGGFTRRQLYNRRGGPSDRGLALLLESGDQIVEILPGLVRIKSREGSIQTIHNLEVEQPFLSSVDPSARPAPEIEPDEDE